MKIIKVVATILVFAIITSCKKTTDDGAPKGDESSSLFRIEASADQPITLYIDESNPNLNVAPVDFGFSEKDQPSPLNYSFKPIIGDEVSVEVDTKASNINVKIFYKGVLIGPGVITNSNKGSYCNYNYTVKD